MRRRRRRRVKGRSVRSTRQRAISYARSDLLRFVDLFRGCGAVVRGCSELRGRSGVAFAAVVSGIRVEFRNYSALKPRQLAFSFTSAPLLDTTSLCSCVSACLFVRVCVCLYVFLSVINFLYCGHCSKDDGRVAVLDMLCPASLNILCHRVGPVAAGGRNEPHIPQRFVSSTWPSEPFLSGSRRRDS